MGDKKFGKNLDIFGEHPVYFVVSIIIDRLMVIQWSHLTHLRIGQPGVGPPANVQWPCSSHTRTCQRCGSDKCPPSDTTVHGTAAKHRTRGAPPETHHHHLIIIIKYNESTHSKFN